MRQILSRYSHLIFLGSLFSLLLVPAIDPNSKFSEESFLGIFTLIIMSSLYVVHRTSKAFKAFLIMGISSFIVNSLSYPLPDPAWDIAAILINLVFVFSVIVFAVRHIFSNSKVNFDVLIQSASVYLLIGIFFSFSFTLVDYLVPHSFVGTAADEVHGNSALFSSFLYYSFVTLTTLGYGDITPVSQLARSLSIIEAITAQLFVTIFMARLVGLHLNHVSK
jgi:voltage-gated potassium channel